jgi:flavin reductase (DIM6/NTAB) family NADH-FMN oxidoreductase RutF
MSIDPSAFRNLLGRFATGVTVVTAQDDGGTHQGMTVSAFCSLSLEPPLVLMCIDKTATMYRLLTKCERFTVNILSADQEETARRFATTETTKFDGIGYSIVGDDAVLDDVLAHAQCTRTKTVEAGDHSIVIGEVRSATVSDGQPLLYFRGGYSSIGR